MGKEKCSKVDPDGYLPKRSEISSIKDEMGEEIEKRDERILTLEHEFNEVKDLLAKYLKSHSKGKGKKKKVEEIIADTPVKENKDVIKEEWEQVENE